MLNICVGTAEVSPQRVLALVFGTKPSALEYSILFKIRIPRAVAAAMLGGALALSGYLLQTFFHNPIAGPFVLGISSGAKLVVALLMVYCLSAGFTITSIAMILAALIGSLICVVFVLLISKTVKSMSVLIVAGVMLSYICTAVTDFVVTFAEDANIVNLHNWSKGSFSGISGENAVIITIAVLVAFVLTFLLSKPMGAYQLGDSYAMSQGVNLKIFKLELIVLSSLLAALVTAFAGPVSFVGIAVPQLVKGILKTTKPMLMIPACFLSGAMFCLICDLIARCAFAPMELSISTVTAVFGAPIVIFVLLKRVAVRQ